jgi:hypothetical protein
VLFPIAEQPSCSHDQQPHQQQQEQQHHSLLGFTFPSAGVSEVLSLAGTTFRQVALPGLQQGSASLLLAGLPGGWLLQVRARRGGGGWGWGDEWGGGERMSYAWCGEGPCVTMRKPHAPSSPAISSLP